MDTIQNIFLEPNIYLLKDFKNTSNTLTLNFFPFKLDKKHFKYFNPSISFPLNWIRIVSLQIR